MSEDFNGILPLYKPKGVTSHDCVLQMRKQIKMKKIGHAGTLDPEVTGVLVICIGRATKMVQYLSNLPKSYEAEITLGTATMTEDASGQVIERKEIESRIPYLTLKNKVESMAGNRTQTPPLYSAVKVKGKKLYEYALEGLHVERPVRKIRIEQIQLLSEHDIDHLHPSFRIRVTCSKGTYIRTLAVDIGKKLGYPAHMSSLIRTKAGPFSLAECLTFAEVEAAVQQGHLADRLFPLDTAVSHFDKMIVDEATAQKIQNGAVLPNTNQAGQKRWAVYHKNGELLAIYVPHPAKPGFIKPEKVIKNS